MCMHIGGSQYKTPFGYMQAYTLANVKSLCPPQQRIPTHPHPLYSEGSDHSAGRVHAGKEEVRDTDWLLSPFQTDGARGPLPLLYIALTESHTCR